MSRLDSVGAALLVREGRNREHGNVTVKGFLDAGRNRIREFINKSKSGGIEIIVCLKNELRPVPGASNGLMVRSVHEFFGDIARSS